MIPQEKKWFITHNSPSSGLFCERTRSNINHRLGLVSLSRGSKPSEARDHGTCKHTRCYIDIVVKRLACESHLSCIRHSARAHFIYMCTLTRLLLFWISWLYKGGVVHFGLRLFGREIDFLPPGGWWPQSRQVDRHTYIYTLECYSLKSGCCSKVKGLFLYHQSLPFLARQLIPLLSGVLMLVFFYRHFCCTLHTLRLDTVAAKNSREVYPR